MKTVVVIADTIEKESRSPPMRNHRESPVRCTYYLQRHLSDVADQLAEIQLVPYFVLFEWQGRFAFVVPAREREKKRSDAYLIIAAGLILFAVFGC
jgi:hypothetical protein